MTKVREIGSFFKLDSSGYVMNEASMNYVLPPWDEVIKKIKKAYIDNLGSSLHSIYLRGSVVRGINPGEISDVDTFALIKDDMSYIDWKEAEWGPKFIKRLRRAYDFIEDVELMISSYSSEYGVLNPGLKMIIKSQSVCIHGEDVSAGIHPYTPGEKMMLNIHWIEEEISEFKKFLSENGDSEKIKIACRKLMKVILRTGFELVMEKENQYTVDLYPCYKTFSKYYSEKENQMYRALELYLEPSDDVNFLRRFINEFGLWLVTVVRNKIRI